MYLKCRSLVACTLDLTFWVIQSLERLFELSAHRFLRTQLGLVQEDLLVSLSLYIAL